MTLLVEWIKHARGVRMALGLEISSCYQILDEMPALPGLEPMIRSIVAEMMRERGKGLYSRRGE
jgi:hypothetical protein